MPGEKPTWEPFKDIQNSCCMTIYILQTICVRQAKPVGH